MKIRLRSPTILYISSRILSYLLTIFIGTTIAFLIPRVVGASPVEALIGRLTAYGDYYEPEVLNHLIKTLKEMYGLEGTLLEQYIVFWRRLLTGDLGVSFYAFPTPTVVLIAKALPWTIGLLTITLFISWLIGLITGVYAAYFERTKFASILTQFSIAIHTIPYYVFALILILLFAHITTLPLVGGHSIGLKPALSLEFILDVLRHAFLPAISLIIVSYGGTFLTTRAYAMAIKNEDYTLYAEMMRINRKIIISKYIRRNALLPQLTSLGISLGNTFVGSLPLEYIFSYPGLGTLLYLAIVNNDYSLIMSIVLLTIVSIATASLILDLIYPLVDPRIRYR